MRDVIAYLDVDMVNTVLIQIYEYQYYIYNSLTWKITMVKIEKKKIKFFAFNRSSKFISSITLIKPEIVKFVIN